MRGPIQADNGGSPEGTLEGLGTLPSKGSRGSLTWSIPRYGIPMAATAYVGRSQGCPLRGDAFHGASRGDRNSGATAVSPGCAVPYLVDSHDPGARPAGIHGNRVLVGQGSNSTSAASANWNTDDPCYCRDLCNWLGTSSCYRAGLGRTGITRDNGIGLPTCGAHMDPFLLSGWRGSGGGRLGPVLDTNATRLWVDHPDVHRNRLFLPFTSLGAKGEGAVGFSDREARTPISRPRSKLL